MERAMLHRVIIAMLIAAAAIATVTIGVAAQGVSNMQKTTSKYIANGAYINPIHGKLKYIGNDTYILLKEDGMPLIINGHVAKIKIVGWINAMHGRLKYVGNDTYILLKEDGTPLVINGHVVKIKIINGTNEPTGVALKTKPDIIACSLANGSLMPGTFSLYGPFTSDLGINVSVVWTPSSQTLDIGIVDVSNRRGYVYWYIGGSATAVFNTDPNMRYYILIISNSANAQNISYNIKICNYNLMK